MYRLASRDGVGLVLGRGRSGSDSLGWSEDMSNRRADAAKRCFESGGGEELYNKRRNMRGADGREGHEFDRQTEMDFADDGKVRHVHRWLSVFIHFSFVVSFIHSSCRRAILPCIYKIQAFRGPENRNTLHATQLLQSQKRRAKNVRSMKQ